MRGPTKRTRVRVSVHEGGLEGKRDLNGERERKFKGDRKNASHQDFVNYR